MVQTHVADPVPFVMWGPGFAGNGASRYTEKDAAGTGLLIDEGYRLMADFTA